MLDPIELKPIRQFFCGAALTGYAVVSTLATAAPVVLVAGLIGAIWRTAQVSPTTNLDATTADRLMSQAASQLWPKPPVHTQVGTKHMISMDLGPLYGQGKLAEEGAHQGALLGLGTGLTVGGAQTYYVTRHMAKQLGCNRNEITAGVVAGIATMILLIYNQGICLETALPVFGTGCLVGGAGSSLANILHTRGP